MYTTKIYNNYNKFLYCIIPIILKTIGIITYPIKLIWKIPPTYYISTYNECSKKRKRDISLN